MHVQLSKQTTSVPIDSMKPERSGILQQKCACGRMPGPAGACTECRRTQPAGQSRLPIRTKLAINQPGDKYEQEADRMADRVMRMPEPHLQRQVEPEEEEEDRISHFRLNDGTALPASARSFMEPRFGHDFTKVKIHTGPQATGLARSLNARAFTVGNDIFFNQGQFQPASPPGMHLLAHELTHTLQQGPEVIRRKGENVPGSQAVFDFAQKILNGDFSSSEFAEALAAADFTRLQLRDLKKRVLDLQTTSDPLIDAALEEIDNVLAGRTDLEQVKFVPAPCEPGDSAPVNANAWIRNERLTGIAQGTEEPLKRGEQGEAVKLVQQALLQWGCEYSNESVNLLPRYRDDGDFGFEMKLGVKEFQKRNGLGRDGIVGVNTLFALQEKVILRSALDEEAAIEEARQQAEAVAQEAAALREKIEAVRFRISTFTYDHIELSPGIAGTLLVDRLRGVPDEILLAAFALLAKQNADAFQFSLFKGETLKAFEAQQPPRELIGQFKLLLRPAPEPSLLDDIFAEIDSKVDFLFEEFVDSIRFLRAEVRNLASGMIAQLPPALQPLAEVILDSLVAVVDVGLDFLLVLGAFGIGGLDVIFDTISGIIAIVRFLTSWLIAIYELALSNPEMAEELLSDTALFFEQIGPALKKTLDEWLDEFEKAHEDKKAAMIVRLVPAIIEAITGIAAVGRLAGQIGRAGLKGLRQLKGGPKNLSRARAELDDLGKLDQPDDIGRLDPDSPEAALSIRSRVQYEDGPHEVFFSVGKDGKPTLRLCSPNCGEMAAKVHAMLQALPEESHEIARALRDIREEALETQRNLAKALHKKQNVDLHRAMANETANRLNQRLADLQKQHPDKIDPNITPEPVAATKMISSTAYEVRVRSSLEPSIGKNADKTIPAEQSLDGKLLQIDTASGTHYVQVKRWGRDKPSPTGPELDQFRRTRNQAIADGKKFAIAFPPHVIKQIAQRLRRDYPGVEIFRVDPF